MTEVKIPNHIMRLKSALLGCRYALDGESLYSVKWYKDGHEIYRYVPRDKPPGQAFPLPGVNIDVSKGWGGGDDELMQQVCDKQWEKFNLKFYCNLQGEYRMGEE